MKAEEMRTHEMRTQETQTQETQTCGMQTEGMKNEKKHRGLWKGRSLVVLATLGVCSMLGACKIISIEQAGGTGDTREIGKTGGTGDTGEIGGTGDTVEISQTGESEILLVERDENYAWGFVSDGGCFVDTNGRLYPYSNGIEHLYDDERGQDFSYLDYLEIIRENYKEEVYIDLKYVDQIKKLGKDLSPDDEFEEIHKMCDYGQDTIYYFDPELRRFLKCKSTGDTDMIPKNKSAEKIADLFWNDIDANLPQTGIFQTVPSLYRPKWCFMTEIEVSDQNEWTGKWILKDRDMLQAFAEQSGIDVTEILTTMEETDINNTAFENYDFKANKVFFVEVKSASDTKEMGSPKVFWICGNCCDYLYDEEKKEESQSPVCLVSAVETWDMPEDLTTLVDFDGNAWKVFE